MDRWFTCTVFERRLRMHCCTEKKLQTKPRVKTIRKSEYSLVFDVFLGGLPMTQHTQMNSSSIGQMVIKRG